MKPRDANVVNELLGQIDAQNEQLRLHTMLRMLNNLVVLLTIVALLIMLIPPLSRPLYYAIVVTSLAVNGWIEWLIRHERERIGAVLLVLWTNLGILLIMVANAIEHDLLRVTIFAETTPLFVILAGLLLGWRFAGLITIGNLIVIFAVYVIIFTVNPTPRGVFEESTGFFIPILIYTILVWVAISFYQWQLSASQRQLNQARLQLMQDQMVRYELELARHIQQRLYPPPPPPLGDIRIVARLEAARETSGDFYDFVQLPDGRWAIVVADVTGKSVPAALMMVMVRSLLRSHIAAYQSPAAVLRATNEMLCRDGLQAQYVTVFLGILDPATSTLIFATAGHPFPYLRRGDQVHEIGCPSLPLGVQPTVEYSEITLNLQLGDQVFLLTDGFFETRNAQRELFGFDRLMNLIRQIDATDPQQALDHMWAAVADFRGELEQSDDITAVIIQRLPEPHYAIAVTNRTQALANDSDQANPTDRQAAILIADASTSSA
ncbi:SpoIIE family protein phosphatase [uncultured Chloroflexus sp.]|uniref:PP2C family protein-serine/threonine phosphatase n=1 Tax=uncultured Chloroflexus sp. TaxID=214040 RepID=UPI00262CE05A|nr:SpoIIE family protein phosphatase [uncultured Chloroflexus sp.]